MVPTNVEKTKCYPYVSLENDSQAMVKFSLTYLYQVGEHKIIIQSTEWMWLPALPNCAQKILLSNSGSLYLTKLSDLVLKLVNDLLSSPRIAYFSGSLSIFCTRELITVKVRKQNFHDC